MSTTETVNPDPTEQETIVVDLSPGETKPEQKSTGPETPPESSGETSEDSLPEGDTFSRKYVEDLRAESARHRTAAKDAAEALEPTQKRLFGLLVDGTGRLADPTDLPFDAALLDDEAALTAAIDGLLAAKPHLASRRVSGDVGQGAGATGGSEAGLLTGILGAGA